MIVDADPSFARKSLKRMIFVVFRRLRSIFGITTTNQAVAGSSPAGRHLIPEKTPEI
jgi:hypothetical protein